MKVKELVEYLNTLDGDMEILGDLSNEECADFYKEFSPDSFDVREIAYYVIKNYYITLDESDKKIYVDKEYIDRNHKAGRHKDTKFYGPRKYLVID